MRIPGPVNKFELQKRHKTHKKDLLCDSCAFVGLPEPTDDRETFATRHWQNFVKRLGSERDQHSGFAVQSKVL